MDQEVSYRHTIENALRAADRRRQDRRRLPTAHGPQRQPGAGRRGAGALDGSGARRRVARRFSFPLAEETGLIQDIGGARPAARRRGRQVVARRQRRRQRLSLADPSRRHRRGGARCVAAKAASPPNRLEIEITESVLLADENRANEQMRGLQGLGVKVALDDFGTGYSSLQYLRRFGFDKLKIDRSFIDGAGAPQDSSIILASIIKLGHDLDLTITAEGVETEEQQRWLQASGCHQLQGYLFSRLRPRR